MNDLTIINRNGQLFADSREVAEMVEKDHKNLLRDIKGYVEILDGSTLSSPNLDDSSTLDSPHIDDSSKLRSENFFIPDTYFNSQNKEQPMFYLTRKGCDMVANKMIGKKGILFTAAYVTKFEEMEKQAFRTPQSFPEALRLAADFAEKNEVLTLQNAQKEQIINELKPKATYCDLILQNKTLLSTTVIAKDYGMAAKSFNKKLHELGIQYKQGETWFLYAKYQDKGYAQSSTFPIDEERSSISTKWTQKGRLFLYDLLKQENILPVIEREGA